jgi:hypothetical protein
MISNLSDILFYAIARRSSEKTLFGLSFIVGIERISIAN